MIIVFGSNVVDLFFDLDALPELGQAIHIATHSEAPGGKGQNQAVAAAKAGAKVRFFGALGDGAHGRSLLENLQACDINTAGIQILKDHPTSVATIFVDKSGDHRVVVSQGANAYAVQSDISDELLTPDTTLLLQAELNLKETAKLMERARARNCKTVILNLAPYKNLSAEVIANIDILVMNEHEATDLGKYLGLGGSSFEDMLRAFNKTYGVTPLITLGEHGAMAFDGKNMHCVPALKITPVDMLGAGDAFCGVLAACIDSGMKLPEAMRYASIAGSLACTKKGAQAALPTLDEVKAKLPELGRMDASVGAKQVLRA
jgi:ribokinase